MSKGEFFGSKRADKGVLIKMNDKKELSFSFIGNKGPLSVTLDAETSITLAEHILDITEAPTTSEPIEFDTNKHINDFKLFSEEGHKYDQLEFSCHVTDADPENHPLLRGSKTESESLTGETEDSE